MRVHFVGEQDDGVNPSSHNAAALASIGVSVQFDADDTWRSRSWRAACDQIDVAHVVTYSQCNWMLLRKLWRARMRGVQIVRYWAGSDCLWARFHAPTRRFAQALGHLGALNLAVADHLVEELAGVSVGAEAVPVITPNISASAQPYPLPKQFTVLCYLPTRRREFYGGQVVDRLIEEMPDVRFIILGDAGTDYGRFENVESLGYVDDLTRTVGRCTVLVRPTHHDGMPRLVLEMLSHGRQAITSHPFPHCHHAGGVDEIRAILRRLQADGEFNLAGRRWACEHFETHRTATVLRDRIQSCLKPGRAARRRKGRWQAMQLLSRCPWILSRKCYPLPLPEELPAEAEALRIVLAGYAAASAQQAASAPDLGKQTCAC
ncbi:MAG: glycosyltransferase [Planctomycetota bacterium]|jgi:hypothetical protein